MKAIRNVLGLPNSPLDYAKPIATYPDDVWTIPVLVVRYFPVDGHRLNIHVTGDVGGPLDSVRNHTIHTTKRIIHTLETGSVYHGYMNASALPSLRYRVIDELEYLEPLPTRFNPAYSHVPMTDYNAIMKRISIEKWVNDYGIKEVWLWGYHGNVVGLWESNMSGPFGDVSNSDRNLHDLPFVGKTYTVYHYNYQRETSEAVEDHMHQIEAILRHIDPVLFWDKFVGKVGEGRCGWAHYPPNGVRDYDWANPRSIMTDIEDWTPGGTGVKKKMNCSRWYGDSLMWFTYWMQNLPGRKNSLSYHGRAITNWWRFIGDFDEAMNEEAGLIEDHDTTISVC